MEVTGCRRALWVGPSLRAVGAMCFKRARLRGFPTPVSNSALQAKTRSTSRSSTPLQSITAATSHRAPVPGLIRLGVCAGQNTGSRQGAAAHPAIEASPTGGSRSSGLIRGQARKRARRGRIAQHLLLARRSRPRPGNVCPLASGSCLTALAFGRGDGRASSIELRHFGRQAGCGRRLLRSRATVCTATTLRSAPGLSATGA